MTTVLKHRGPDESGTYASDLKRVSGYDEVPGVALDGYAFELDHPKPDAIKMDIEGGEVLAIKGVERILQEIRPLLLVELHGHEAARAVWESLARHHYTIYRMQPGYPQVNSVDQLD